MLRVFLACLLASCAGPTLDNLPLCGDLDAPLPADASLDTSPDAPLTFDMTTPWVRHTIYAGLSGADGANLATINGKLSIATPWEQSARTTVSTLDAGVWTTVQLPGTVSAPEDAIFADVDSDGVMDVVTLGDASKRIYIHFGPSYTLVNLDAATNIQNWLQADFVDIDGDGSKEIVAGGRIGANAGVGYFTSPTPRVASSWTWHPIAPAGWVQSMVPRDVDADGDLDIVVSDAARIGTDNSLMGSRWLEQTGTEWVSHRIYNYKGSEGTVQFLDVAPNRVIDGSSTAGPSLLNIRTTTDWLTWSATPVPWPADAGQLKGVRAADIDGDGIEDLAISMHHADTDYTTAPEDLSGVLWLKGPTWERGEVSGPAGVKYDNLEMLDVDGDGDLDIITTEQGIAGITPAADKLGLIWYENPR